MEVLRMFISHPEMFGHQFNGGLNIAECLPSCSKQRDSDHASSVGILLVTAGNEGTVELRTTCKGQFPETCII